MIVLGAGDFGLASCQATIFTPDSRVSSARLVRDLLPKWSDRFDGDPVILPAVEGLPLEVPRVTLQSGSGEWRCEIASARVNLYWRKVSADSKQLDLPGFYATAAALLSEYSELDNHRVGRLAAILNWFGSHDSPGLFLSRHFCKERWHDTPLNRPAGFELHAHKTFKMADKYMVNSWVRNKTASIGIGDSTEPIVLVEQDLNTFAEDAQSADYSTEDITHFFGASAAEFPTILSLYYPEADSS